MISGHVVVVVWWLLMVVIWVLGWYWLRIVEFGRYNGGMSYDGDDMKSNYYLGFLWLLAGWAVTAAWIVRNEQ